MKGTQLWISLGFMVLYGCSDPFFGRINPLDEGVANCTAGRRMCRGNEVLQCNTSGQGLSVVETCQAGYSCFYGQCVQDGDAGGADTPVTPAALVISDSPEYDFGTGYVGYGYEQSFSISHSGGALATSVVFSQLNAPFELLNNSCGEIISAYCTFIIRFTPTASGEANETLTVSYHNGIEPVEATLALIGDGKAPAVLSISSDDGSADFGEVIIGNGPEKDFTINYSGEEPAKEVFFASSTLTFSLVESNCGESISGPCSFRISFSPQSSGDKIYPIEVSYHNGKEKNLATKIITGIGLTPAHLVINNGSSQYDFGLVNTGNSSSWPCEIRNTGEFPATLATDFGLSDPFKMVSNGCGESVTGSCQIWVSFTPLKSGEISDTLHIDYHDGRQDLKDLVVLSGDGNYAFQEIFLGGYHAFAKDWNGSSFGWGYNNRGQLGNGSTNNSNMPIPIGNGTDWDFLALGGSHTCGLRANGTLWCWGANWSGQVGNGSYNDSNIPIRIGNGTDWDFLALGESHTCGLRSNGALWCWGSNYKGQLGNGSTDNSLIPILIGNDTDWDLISLGGRHTCGLRSNGTLWCWGDNWSGQLGNGSSINYFTIPLLIGNDTDWDFISLGGNHTCGLKTNKTLWCWGSNYNGSLGNGSTNESHIPIRIGTDTDWDWVALGGGHTCGLRSNGALWCWGNNYRGQLGDGSTNESHVPILIEMNARWDFISLGYSFTCGIKTDGSLYCWGDNNSGQLGDGTTYDKHIPTRILTPTY